MPRGIHNSPRGVSAIVLPPGTVLIRVSLIPETHKAVDRWRREQEVRQERKITQAEAVRTLLEIGLSVPVKDEVL